MSNDRAGASKYEANRVFTIVDDHVLRLSPRLAEEIGLMESILLLQIEFWLGISNNVRDGRKWVYKSLSDLEQSFPFRGKSTFNRALHSLLKRGLIIEGNYNRHRYDKTRWFALNLEEIVKLSSIELLDQNSTTTDQNGTRSEQNSTRKVQSGTRSAQEGTRKPQNSTTIPERTTENTTDTTADGPAPSPVNLTPNRESVEEVLALLSGELSGWELEALRPRLESLPPGCRMPRTKGHARWLLNDDEGAYEEFVHFFSHKPSYQEPS